MQNNTERKKVQKSRMQKSEVQNSTEKEGSNRTVQNENSTKNEGEYLIKEREHYRLIQCGESIDGNARNK